VPRLKQPEYVTREARAGYSFGAEETGKEEPVDNNLEKKSRRSPSVLAILW